LESRGGDTSCHPTTLGATPTTYGCREVQHGPPVGNKEYVQIILHTVKNLRTLCCIQDQGQLSVKKFAFYTSYLLFLCSMFKEG
jgi:hypothetical protein